MSRADRLRLAWCGLHPDRVRRLVADWGSAGAVLRAIERGQIEVGGSIRSTAAVAAAERRLQAEAAGVRLLFSDEPEYPTHLAVLPDAPHMIFVRGRLPANPGVAVVGTRRCSGYGRGLARAFGAAVAEAGWPLVSGLARGIDGEAHRGTVAAGGIGVAVLGSGPDVWYPPEHRPLADALVAGGGAVVTEYPPGTAPEGWRFPPRNRIIAGLAGAVVVIEAGEKGGALITAAAALDQGRTVFAVPGDVDRESSVGCNRLIRDGAVPVLGPDDLIEGLSLVLGPARRAPRGAGDPLVEALGAAGSTLDELAVRLGVGIGEVAADVSRLEIDGRVIVDHGVVRAALRSGAG